MRRSDSRRAGFTLTELMVAMAMLLVVVTLTQTFVVQHRTYVVVDQVSEAQQNLRAVAWLLERDVRMAGFMVAEAAAACALDNTNAADALYVSDSDAIDPTGPVSPGAGAEVSSGYSGGAGLKTLSVDEGSTAGRRHGAFYDTDGDGAKDADFRVNGGAILVDIANSNRGRACGVVRS